ncbi:MAG TPA: pilus assembly protein PilM [Clostridiales bacterium]|nr:pilus assembly protein PilM [Clostridiales bacterium]HQP69240.1 pilus assembly protein PilM [Clostridiales bacterium]
MSDETKKDTGKSIGRNIFSEGGADIFKSKSEMKSSAGSEKENSPKSMGRNIFSEVQKSPEPSRTTSGIEDLKIIEKSPRAFSEKKSAAAASGVKTSKINAIHVTKENVSFAQTVFDGIQYRLTNLQVIPIELPQLTEENLLKDKEDPELVIKRLQIEAIDKVFTRASVPKNDPMIVSSLNGPNIILRQLYVQNTPPENIELELPRLIKSPFNEAMSRYEYLLLNSDGMNHDVLASIVDSSTFFSSLNIFNNAGIDCQILDIDKMAIVNLYNESVKPPKGTVSCIIDINNDYSHIMIIPSGNEELYIRNIEFTFSAFKKMLQKNRDISIAETEEMIRTRNFYDYITNAFEAETTENLNQHYSVKKYVRMQLLRELQKTFQYYSQQNQNKIPSKIYITGKALEMCKFAQFINKNTDIPCDKLDVSGFFNGDGTVLEYAKEKESIAYVAIGLALRYE